MFKNREEEVFSNYHQHTSRYLAFLSLTLPPIHVVVSTISLISLGLFRDFAGPLSYNCKQVSYTHRHFLQIQPHNNRQETLLSMLKKQQITRRRWNIVCGKKWKVGQPVISEVDTKSTALIGIADWVSLGSRAISTTMVLWNSAYSLIIVHL